MWDEAIPAEKMETVDINAAMESQITYWQSYNENLDKLLGRANEIEGLSDVIGSFAD